MRSLRIRSAVLAGAFLLVAGAATNALAGDDELSVKVPFAFVVHGQNFPAGTYSIQRENASSPVLLIRGDDGKYASMVVMTRPAGGRDPAGSIPALTFTRGEQNQLQLSTVWESHDDGLRVVGR